jgi:hypothetical protein
MFELVIWKIYSFWLYMTFKTGNVANTCFKQININFQLVKANTLTLFFSYSKQSIRKPRQIMENFTGIRETQVLRSPRLKTSWCTSLQSYRRYLPKQRLVLRSFKNIEVVFNLFPFNAWKKEERNRHRKTYLLRLQEALWL